MSELDAGTRRQFVPIRGGVDGAADSLGSPGPVGPSDSVNDDGNSRSVAHYRYRARIVSGFFGIAGYLATFAVIVHQVWGR